MSVSLTVVWDINNSPTTQPQVKNRMWIKFIYSKCLAGSICVCEEGWFRRECRPTLEPWSELHVNSWDCRLRRFLGAPIRWGCGPSGTSEVSVGLSQNLVLGEDQRLMIIGVVACLGMCRSVPWLNSRKVCRPSKQTLEGGKGTKWHPPASMKTSCILFKNKNM